LLTCRSRRVRIFVSKFGQCAIEFVCETRPREYGVNFSDGLDCKTQRSEIASQAVGQFAEDSRNLRRFVLGKLHQLIVVLDGFKRLDENRLPRRACGAARPRARG
jgi:hypothetical protein